MSFPIIISIVVFFSILLLFMSAIFFIRRVAGRRETIEKIKRGSDRVGEEKVAAKSRGVTNSILNSFASIGSRMNKDKSLQLRRRQLDFLRAGIRRSNALAVLWGAKVTSAVVLFISFLALKATFWQLVSNKMTILVGLVLVLIGFYIPDLWLRYRVSKRKNLISKGLPDALDLLVVCVEAGMGLDAAIYKVGEELQVTNPVLSDEFRFYNFEIKAGKSRHDALRNLSLRTDNLEDIDSLVTLLVQTDKFGTSIASALRVHSDAFRTKRYQKAEEIAAKLPVKLLFPLALFIFPGLFVVILGPAAISIYHALIKR